jgi:hypothetical protein
MASSKPCEYPTEIKFFVDPDSVVQHYTTSARSIVRTMRRKWKGHKAIVILGPHERVEDYITVKAVTPIWVRSVKDRGDLETIGLKNTLVTVIIHGVGKI